MQLSQIIRGSAVALVALTALVGCKKKGVSVVGNGSLATATPTVSQAASSGKPTTSAKGSLPPGIVEKVTNPDNDLVYSGPVGTVAGTIRVSGDAPPVLDDLLKKIPLGKCFSAHERYKYLFREGPDRGVTDALVAITRYEGHTVPLGEPPPITAKDCSYDARTVVLTYGQSVRVINKGGETYMPQLLGGRAQALLIAMPGGKPISMLPPRPGQYQVVDRSHEHIFADVYVLAYPTATVTTAGGKFEIKNVPVGKAHLNVLLPTTNGTVEQSILVEAGKVTTVNLTIDFDLKAFEAVKSAAKIDKAPGVSSDSGLTPPRAVNQRPLAPTGVPAAVPAPVAPTPAASSLTP